MLATPVILAFLLQPATLRLYTDPAARFTFSYPGSWGSTSPGTNDGFLDRIAAVTFSALPVRFKGEAALTRGFPVIDLQAVGGLYDAITLEIFPEPLRRTVISQLPRLTVTNFCDELGRRTHIDPNLPVFASLPAAQRQAMGQTDVMRNANPRVVECRRTGDIVVFDKERSFRPGDPIQHVFGAVRFLSEPFSTFQLVAGGDTPDRTLLTAIADVVASFKAN